MRIVLQRVKNASVKVENQTIGDIAPSSTSGQASGLLLLFGVTHGDTEKDAEYLTDKILKMRIFSDKDDKMNLSMTDIGGSILVVSQFTLYADCKKGNRPSFIDAAKPDEANRLYEYFVKYLRKTGIKVETGKFGAMMEVALVNDGPVTIILDTKNK